LGLDAWLRPATIDHFLAYVRAAVGYLLRVLPAEHDCPPPRYYITVNEPNMLASCTYLLGAFPSGDEKGLRPFLACLEALLEAHVRAYRLVHTLYQEAGVAAPLVSFNNYCSDLYWNDQAWLDLMFAAHRRIPREKVFSHLWECAWAFDRSFDEARIPIRPWVRRISGEMIKKAQHFMAYACSFDSEWSRLADLIYETDRVPLDYLAIDYYDPFAAHALRLPYWQDNLSPDKGFYERFINSVTSKWWDWKLLPDGLAFFVRSLGRFNLPILIAENGMAIYCKNDDFCSIRRDKVTRSEYVQLHVKMVTELVQEGHPLFGYLYWSLVDNYEWGTYSARFGLYFVDFSHPGERRETNFFGDNAAAAYAQAVVEAKKVMVSG
jgi:beta-glucosidase/6-phospho-beta-glucosidase/beta-galactosidase